jgi:CBS domain-containing protein
MAWPVATLAAEGTLQEVAEALAADEIGALVVLVAGRAAGVVSERDVVAHVAEDVDLGHVTAGEVMGEDLVEVAPDDTVLEAGRRMRDAGVRHLPVLDHGLIAGMVSLRDVAEVLLDSADLEDVVVVRSGTRVVVRDS